jgi:hypothetical protein
VAYAHPLSKVSGIGFGANYIDYGDFQGKDQFGQNTGTFGAHDVALSAGYGKLLRSDFGIGINVKYIQSKIANYGAGAVAGDFGILYYLAEKQVTIGFSALNFGRTTDAFLDTEENLPSQLKFGITKQLAHLPFLLTGELRRFSDGDVYINAGGELKIGRSICLRAGYSSVGQDQKMGISNERWAGFSIGAGVLINKMVLDYALSSLGAIGAQNRLTLSAFF